MTLDDKIEKASGRFVVIAMDQGGQLLDSDNSFASAEAEAKLDSDSYASVVIVDKDLGKGAEGIVWRSTRSASSPIEKARAAGVLWAERAADVAGPPSGPWSKWQHAPDEASERVDSADPQERARLGRVLNEAAAKRWAELVAMPRSERIRGFLERTRGDALGRVVFDVDVRRYDPSRWVQLGTVKAVDDTHAQHQARQIWLRETLLVKRRGGPAPLGAEKERA